MLSLAARAKINLFLHAVGKRADGYHLLESLVTFADTYDIVSVAPAEHITLEIRGKFSTDLYGDNIILKAAHLLAEKTTTIKGAAITLTKELPIASGIGGGSADAAATLHLLQKCWNISLAEEEILALALSIGADVPMCYVGQSAFISGIGEHITPVSEVPAIPAILVNPLQSVSTPTVFGVGVTKFSSSVTMPSLNNITDIIDFLKTTRNDLEQPAISLLPAIATILEIISIQNGCLLSRMSGSGATCFGLFSTIEEAEKAAYRVQQCHPEWWVKATMLGTGKE